MMCLYCFEELLSLGEEIRRHQAVGCWPVWSVCGPVNVCKDPSFTTVELLSVNVVKLVQFSLKGEKYLIEM